LTELGTVVQAVWGEFVLALEPDVADFLNGRQIVDAVMPLWVAFILGLFLGYGYRSVMAITRPANL